MAEESEHRADLPEPPAADRLPDLRADAVVEHFRAIIESSDDAIIAKSLDGTITSWNQGAEAMFGYSASEMIGSSMYMLLPPERHGEEDAILAKLRAGEKVDHIETTRLRKDGSEIHVSVTSSPILDRGGKVIGASKIARDFTFRKLAEARLVLASTFFTHTHEGVVITDANGIIVDLNESFLRMSGYDREDIIGQSPRMFRSACQGPEVIAAMADALAAAGTWQGEAWSRRKDGEAYAGLLTVNAVRNADGGIENYIALVVDITPLRIKQQEMEYLANFDSLTGLANRLLLADRLGEALSMARRAQHTVAVLYLDLDDFKEVNDTHGHDVGDQVLIALAQRMKESIRDADTVARMGGDEFVVVLPNAGAPGEYTELAERILRACSRPVRVDGIALQVSASIGMTVFPEDGVDAEQLMRHADQAMFVAKQAGRNRIHVFDSAFEAKLQDRSAQLARIAEALEARELALHYQPKVNMREGTVIGVEALIRWAHPERGLLAPAAFLPVIEEHPLEYLIGDWVIESALVQMDAWLAAGLRLPVSVNVGARQLQRAGFGAGLAALLAKYPRVNPSDLELEILESSALQDIGAVAAGMCDCRVLGVRFSMDDFGTGYSSLAYLRRLPAETLKIDQSFVRDMLVDCEDLAIVQSVIALALAFRRAVIAEGVETVEIGERLLDLGCDIAQGFVVARPMAGRELPAWVANWRGFPSWTHRAPAA